MRFVHIDDPKPANLDKIGKVEYVVWRNIRHKDDVFVQMFPNNAKVNDRQLIASAMFPEEAWEAVLSKRELINEFGIEV